MDQITHEVRSAHWLKIIEECQKRPNGMTAKEWLTSNGINRKSYYYWLRKFRKQAYEEQKEALTVPSSDNEISFAEMHFPSPDGELHPMGHNFCTSVEPVAVIQCTGGSIAVTNEISENVLSVILREALHA